MLGWHHRLDGHEFEQTPGVSEGQGSLVCCSPRGLTPDWDTTERLNDNHKCQMLVWGHNSEKKGRREEEKEGRREEGKEKERRNKWMEGRRGRRKEDEAHVMKSNGVNHKRPR